jgi:ribosomal protein S18 acetylase RimI-like enzyme
VDNVEIVELPVDRWREYRELRLAALRSDPIAFGSTYAQSVEYPEEFWRSRLDNPPNFILFAERDGRLVGTAAAIVGGEGDAAGAQIVGVFVLRGYRGQGIARRLMDWLLARLAERSEIERIRLDVTETQAPAIALYQSLGFVVVGRLQGEIRRGDRSYDELVMERVNRASNQREEDERSRRIDGSVRVLP